MPIVLERGHITPHQALTMANRFYFVKRFAGIGLNQIAPCRATSRGGSHRTLADRADMPSPHLWRGNSRGCRKRRDFRVAMVVPRWPAPDSISTSMASGGPSSGGPNPLGACLVCLASFCPTPSVSDGVRTEIEHLFSSWVAQSRWLIRRLVKRRRVGWHAGGSGHPRLVDHRLASFRVA